MSHLTNIPLALVATLPEVCDRLLLVSSQHDATPVDEDDSLVVVLVERFCKSASRRWITARELLSCCRRASISAWVVADDVVAFSY